MITKDNKQRSFRIFSSSAGLAGGETSALVFNGATLNLEQLGKSKLRITGFTVYGHLQSGATIFVPVDQILTVTITSTDKINDKEVWGGSATGASFFTPLVFSGVFEKSCTYIKYDGAVMSATSVMQLQSRAINLTGVIAGDLVSTNIIIHYEYV